MYPELQKSGYSHSDHQYQHTDSKRESVSCPRMFIYFVWKSTLTVCAAVTCIWPVRVDWANLFLIQFSQSQRRAREINSFLTFAKNAGRLLVSWSRLSRNGKHSRAGSLDTTVKKKVFYHFSIADSCFGHRILFSSWGKLILSQSSTVMHLCRSSFSSKFLLKVCFSGEQQQ